MILISVVVPIYNVERYIERCARSLFEQTMNERIEFIFVDDCSPDRSIEILSKILEEYPSRKSHTKSFIIRRTKDCPLHGVPELLLPKVNTSPIATAMTGWNKTLT